MFIQNKLNQKLTVFSDGSLFLDICRFSYNKKIITYLSKDLKNFQKTFQKTSLNNSIKLNNISRYRKKYF
jgi:hypothetical protein